MTTPSRSNRGKLYVVQIGNKTEQSPNRIEEQMGRGGGLTTAPQRLNGLGLKQQSTIRKSNKQQRQGTTSTIDDDNKQ